MVMKIAVTYENGEVFGHFGHTPYFKMYEVNGKMIEKEEIKSTLGSGHGALAGFLKENGVEVLICGGMGGGAKMALAQAGIAVYGGVSGDADKAVKEYLDGTLQYSIEATCSGHGTEGGHHCGHNCSEDKNGCHGNN